ncbi:MAG: hypothetical protein PWP08_1840 [Methanofollis sp.]|nr:hypothetical protein [Methanofollis sp.]
MLCRCERLHFSLGFRIKSGLIPAISMAGYSLSTRNYNNVWFIRYYEMVN